MTASIPLINVPRWSVNVHPGLDGIDLRRARAYLCVTHHGCGTFLTGALLTTVHVRPTRSGALGFCVYANRVGTKERLAYRDDREGD